MGPFIHGEVVSLKENSVVTTLSFVWPLQRLNTPRSRTSTRFWATRNIPQTTQRCKELIRWSTKLLGYSNEKCHFQTARCVSHPRRIDFATTATIPEEVFREKYPGEDLCFGVCDSVRNRHSCCAGCAEGRGGGHVGEAAGTGGDSRGKTT